MSDTCKNSNEELFQSNNKTKQYESIIQNERDFSPKFLENATVQHENFKPETFENVTSNIINENNNNIVSKKNSVKSLQFVNVSTHFKAMEEMEINETLNDNISRLNFNNLSTEFFKSNHTQSKNESSNISLSYSLRSTPKTFIINDMGDRNKFSSRSSVDSRVSAPSWTIGSNSNFPIDFDNQTSKQAKSCRKNNEDNRGVTFMSDLNHERVSEERMQTAQFDERGPNFNNEKIIMAVNHRNRKLGCAYYNLETSKLYLMEDIDETFPYDLLNLLRFQILPTVIIANSNADDDFIEILKTQDDSISVEPELIIRPSTEFLYTSAKTKLLSVHFGEYNHVTSKFESSKRETYLQLSCIVNMESVETICCAGALISYISRAKITEGMPEDQPIEISQIEQFSLKRFLHINADALCSLQIFEDESHPNMHMQSRSKEGLSLFGILNNTRTLSGKQLLKQWFLRPTLDLSIIDERHRTIECFLQTDNLEYSGQLVSYLKNIKNIPKIIDNIKGNLNIKDWQSLLQFAFYCLEIRNIVREVNHNGNIQIFTKVMETLIVDDLKDIGSYINVVIDFDESVKENRVVVKAHIDEELDHMKRTYDGLDDFLSEVAREISTTIPSEFALTLNVIYFPQLGYLITVPLKPEWKEEEDFKIDGLYYQFSTATTVYYKNNRMKELDEYLGDIHGLIVDREIEIMQKFQDHILEYASLLLNATAVCAELDCLLSLAESARKFKYCRPHLVNENILEIVKGRHPLQELCVDIFVANDTKIAGGNGIIANENDSPNTSTSSAYKSIMLLSGANYSGKSIYLKQVALITYMAHIGSFVPADSATIGLTDKIFTRVQTRETVSKIQSAFMIDLQQISIALRNSTSRSLLIFDEFGKGTGSNDGAGLFCGVIEHLLGRGRDCPKVIAATHFHEIFENDLLPQVLPISLATMEIMRDDEKEELTFLYRLVPGRSTTSWGTFCAAFAGVPSHIVKRASHLSQLFARYEFIPPSFGDDHERRTYATCEQVARRFVHLDFNGQNSEFENFLEWVSRECE
ncbi:MutS family protein MSH5 [Rhizophagus clarus]|uniref:DNA mismatch repair protein MSH5 n=1 Tax=Rhizophagus clarus TaxID=94130 RepID=A0A8H3QK11_9GLOM|nr:MutS family protein MSH5 [Rhizophagus clarus]